MSYVQAAGRLVSLPGPNDMHVSKALTSLLPGSAVGTLIARQWPLSCPRSSTPPPSRPACGRARQNAGNQVRRACTTTCRIARRGGLSSARRRMHACMHAAITNAARCFVPPACPVGSRALCLCPALGSGGLGAPWHGQRPVCMQTHARPFPRCGVCGSPGLSVGVVDAANPVAVEACQYLCMHM